VLVLRGAYGSGRADVLESACERAGLRVRQLGGAGEGVVGPVGATGTLGTRVLVPPAADVVTAQVLEVYLDLSARTGSVLALPTESVSSDLLDDPAALLGGDVEVVDVPRLTRDQLRSLARDVLQGDPAAALLRELSSASDGLAGRAGAVLRDWRDADRVVWTEDGLDLAASSPPTPPLVGPPHALRALSPTALDVLSIVAASRSALSADEVRAVRAACFPGQLDGWDDDTVDVLGDLASLGLVEHSWEGYGLSRLAPRQPILDRVRPDLRRSLQSRTADDGLPLSVPEPFAAPRCTQPRRTAEGRWGRFRSEACVVAFAAQFAELAAPLLAT